MIAYATYQPAGISVLDLSSGRAPDAGERAGGVHLADVHSGRRERRLRARRGDGGRSAHRLALGGGGRRLSVGRGSDNVSPSFSPDGRRIAFMSATCRSPGDLHHGCRRHERRICSRRSPSARIPIERAPIGRPTAGSSRSRSQIAGNFQILTINLRDRSLKQLTSDGRNEDPSWAPDGRHLAFVSNRTGARQLWVLDVETGTYAPVDSWRRRSPSRGVVAAPRRRVTRVTRLELASQPRRLA